MYVYISYIYISLELLGELEELSGEHRESSEGARANSSPNLHKLMSTTSNT